MVWLCIAVHLYAGPIEPGTQVTEVVEECSRVSSDVARRFVSDCAAEGATRCEALEVTRRAPIGRATVIEHKVRVPK